MRNLNRVLDANDRRIIGLATVGLAGVATIAVAGAGILGLAIRVFGLAVGG